MLNGGFVELWNGTDANGGATKNNAGQHPEPGLGCNLAVYHIDIANGTLEQWRRDVVTGIDLEMVWSQPLGEFWETYISDKPGGWSKYLIMAFQAYGDFFALYAPRYSAIGGGTLHWESVEVRKFDTGEIEYSAEFLLGTSSNDIHNPSDILPISDNRILTYGNPSNASLFSVGTTWEYNTGTNSVDLGLSPSMEDVTECEVSGRVAAQRGSIVPGVDGRPSFARINGIYSHSIDGNFTTEENPTWRYKTSHKSSPSPCDHAHLGEFTDVLGANSVGRFTSPFCSQIYHVPSFWSNGVFQAQVLRFDPATEATEIIPFNFYKTGDWMHIVEDDWPLPDGTKPLENCDPATKCGDRDSSGGPEDCCFGPLEPLEIVGSIIASGVCANVPFGDCNTSFSILDCTHVAGEVTLSPTCPNDAIGRFVAILYDDAGVPSPVEPCYYQLTKVSPTFWSIEAFYPTPGLGDGGCYHVEFEAETIPGRCEEFLSIGHSLNEPACPF